MNPAVARPVTYLRLSVTDRCNLRCIYCAYWQDWQKQPAAEILRYEELLRVAALAVKAGIRKIRITGGEPLLRRGIVGLVRELSRIGGLDQLCLTTNGVHLEELALDLYQAGLLHLNVSLDTLKRERYLKITGSDSLVMVLAGLQRAVSSGFKSIKLNCVVLKGLNDDELLEIASLARDHPWQVRFIELMPSTSLTFWKRHFLPMAEVRRRLAPLGLLTPLPREASAGPARTFAVPGFRGQLGFISPMSSHHCNDCNRLRLTAEGQLRPCLWAAVALDLKAGLRQEVGDEAVLDLIRKAMNWKRGVLPLPRGSAMPTLAPMVSLGG